MEDEEERHSELFLEFAYRLKMKKKANESQSDGPVFWPSIHPDTTPNAESNLPMIHLQNQNSGVISPYFQKNNNTLESNTCEITSPYFQKALDEEKKRGSEAPLESESRSISPYFRKKKRVVSGAVACSGSDSNLQRLMSPCSQKAVTHSGECCNFPNEFDMKKKKKKKKKGNDRLKSFDEEEEEEEKINVQNFRTNDQKMGIELPVFKSYPNAQRKVSPFFEKAVKDEQEMDLETQGESKSTVISPYFQNFVSNSTPDSGSQRLLSPDFLNAMKKEESSSEHCNFPNRIERRKIKKRKQKGNGTVESSKRRRKKKKVQSFGVEEDQENNVQQPISYSNSISQRIVSPYFESLVKEKEGISDEETKKGLGNEESFKKEDGEEAQNITMEDEKVKLPKKKTRAPPVRVVSPYFPINEEDVQKPVRAMHFNKRNVAYKRISPDNDWKPPPSHFHLLQEDHYDDPWRVMVICMLLNCTTGRQASRVISDLFALCPDARTAMDVPTETIEKVIETLGLQKKRAAMIQRFSREYLDEGWTYVTQLHGIGKYAADAYAIFCSGDWGLVVPNDHMLVKYWKFLYSYHSLQMSQKKITKILEKENVTNRM